MKQKKFCVIGCGNFGYYLAVKLFESGAEVIAVDKNPDRIDLLSDLVTEAICMDTTDKKSLQRLPLIEMDAVIVAMGEEFESSILTTALLQDLGIKKIYSRILSPTHKRLLSLMGINEMLVPEEEAAEHLTSRLMISELIEIFKITDDYGIYEIEVPDIFVNKKLIDINIRQEFLLNVVTVKKKVTKKRLFSRDENVVYNVVGVPSPDMVLEKNDILVLSGFYKDFMKLIK